MSSTQRTDDAGFRLSAGLVNAAIKHANRNPDNHDAQRLATEMCDALAAYRAGNGKDDSA